MTRHLCHAKGCAIEVPPKMLMCRRHWYRVPQAIRNAVWAHYRPGQESGQAEVTQDYIRAADAAIDAVAQQEGARS